MKFSQFSLKIVGLTFVALALLSSAAFAKTLYLKQFKEMYPKAKALHSCAACHAGIPKLNPYGLDHGKFEHDFRAIELLDSDGDTFTNLEEIEAETSPGSKDSHSPPAP